MPAPPASGKVMEIAGAAGSGKTEWLLRELARRPELRVAWIETGLTVYPVAFSRHGVLLERVLFLEPKAEDLLWSVQQILRSQLFEVVVLGRLQAGALDEMDLRRLQLLSEKCQASVVLLGEAPTAQGAWPISVQLEISRVADPGARRESRLECRVRRQRQAAQTGSGTVLGAIPSWGQKAWEKLGLLPTG